MNNWQPETIQFLDNSDYNDAALIYEQLIEENPDEINNYFYLGLLYLLQEREEEAQSTWFYILSQANEEEFELWNHQLVTILDTEAKRQASKNNYLPAQLIRFHLQEIYPNDVNNLLHLVKLGLLTKSFDFNSLREWKVCELLEEINLQQCDSELLLNVLADILFYPAFDCVTLAKISLKLMAESEEEEQFKQMLEQVINIGRHMGYNQKIRVYSAELLEQCLIYDPDNINLLIDICLQYNFGEKWQDSLKYADLFEKKSQDLFEKIYAKYLFITIYFTMSNWQKAKTFFNEYKQLLHQMITEKTPIKNQFLKEGSLAIVQPILYIQDNQQENRYLINNLSRMFQMDAQEQFCCPVNFFPSDQLTQKKKLKIGYIGQTLKSHSVGWLSRWLINYHNKDQFEIAIYTMSQYEDEITRKWFKEKADIYHALDRNILAAITQIEKDEIDILVDLDSLTFNLTNLVMSLKPAPIQITWLGWDASGIPAVDYFIADPYVLPENAQEYYQEKIWRLPHTYLGVDGFEVDVPTITREDLEIPTDAVIYLNIQNALKRHPDMIHVQMKILKAVANSYLLIKGNGDQETIKQMFINIAQEEGIAENRLRFLEQTPTEAIHRANLKIADVVLDTYPYNGATTTMETLWMEIPLVTRVGEQFAARNSYTFMMNAGITEGIAWNEEEYIEWGIKLGTDENLRQQISWKLRQSKKASPLWNGKQFAREMEKAYQQMWQIYINSANRH